MCHALLSALYTLGICMGELGLLEAGLKELKEALLARKASYGVSHINVGWGRIFL